MHPAPNSSTSTRTFFSRAAGDHPISRSSVLAGVGLAGLLGGCAGHEPAEPLSIGQAADPLASDNGLSINGLSINGLSINGLSINGLSINGLSKSSFSSWFNQNQAYSPMVMSYLVKCALPSGRQLSWQNPSTGTSYTWPGDLGLAPGWSGGAPATLAEQQVISACLAAHANKFGVHVPLAVEGRDATGVQIPMAPGELTSYPVREGCFFGNFFTGDGIYVGLDHATWDASSSSGRACAFDTSQKGSSTVCPPLLNVGACHNLCTADPTGVYYTQCTYGGKTYLPVTTRLTTSDIFKCGDGTCQFTESCGNGGTYNNCRSDCGLCP